MKRLAIILATGLMSSCGAVGAPVAPETVGVAPTIERQKKEHEATTAQQREAAAATDTEQPDPALLEQLEQDELLPPLLPVGTR
jgi:hypothetical protein